jgi:hypothetical protein
MALLSEAPLPSASKTARCPPYVARDRHRLLRAAEVEQRQPFTPDWVERLSDPQPEPDCHCRSGLPARYGPEDKSLGSESPEFSDARPTP